MGVSELPRAGDVAAWRAAKDRWLEGDSGSPLWGDEEFRGLTYYPERPDYKVVAALQRATGPDSAMLATSTGDERLYLVFGVATFELDGVRQELTLFVPPEAAEGPRLFVPFRDATSGSETYGAGRYLDLTLAPAGGAEALTIDFNYAYSPFCAYAEGYSCPFPPPQNWLSVPVRAGERLAPAGDTPA
jgi:uncharacterized protein (DUF1684 family)